MKDINIRFKQLRIKTHKTQEQLGRVLGITKSGVSDIENGRRDVTEQHIKFLLLWDEYHISEEWLRYGIGNDMFCKMDRNDEIASWASRITRSDNDKCFANQFAYILTQLDENDWNVLEKLATLIYESKKTD